MDNNSIDDLLISNKLNFRYKFCQIYGTQRNAVVRPSSVLKVPNLINAVQKNIFLFKICKMFYRMYANPMIIPISTMLWKW